MKNKMLGLYSIIVMIFSQSQSIIYSFYRACVKGNKFPILAHFILVSFSFQALGQQPISLSITSKEGLPSNIVYKLTQDDLGQIWLATDNGIAIYDGQKVNKVNFDNLNDHFFAYIDRDLFGNIWMLNISGQLYVVNPIEMVAAEKIQLESDEVIKQYFITDSLLWISVQTLDKNFYLKCYKISENGDVQLVNEIGKNNIKEIFSISKDNNQTYISYYDIENTYRFANLNSEVDTLIGYEIDGLVKDVIILGDKSYIAKSRNQNEIIYRFKNIDRHYDLGRKITGVTRWGENIYISTVSGYVEAEINKEKLILKSTVFPNLSINSIFMCREGLLWLSTYNDGVHILKDKRNISFPITDDKGRKNEVTAISELQDKIVFGTNHGQVISMGNDGLVQHTNASTRINKLVAIDEVLYYGNSNGLWSIQTNGSVQHHAKGVVKSFDIIEGQGDTTNEAILSCSHGSTILDISSSKSTNLSSPLNQRSYSSLEVKRGEIWIGNTNGLYTYNYNTGLVQSKELPFSISDMILSDNSVYVSTFANGIYHFSKNAEPIKLDLPSEQVLDMHYDNSKIAMATGDGVYLYDTQSDNFSWINDNNLLTSNNTKCVHLKNGYLYVGSDEGISKIELTSTEFNPDISLTITGLFTDGNRQDLSAPINLGHDVKNLKLRFQAVGFNRNEELSIEYRLVGLDNSWNPTNQKEILYSNLNSGSYEFQLRLANSNESSKSLSLSIAPIWYKTTIGRIAMFILFSALIYWMSKVSLQQKQKKEGIQRKKVKQIESLQMTALQNHMNPHFISNALYNIQDLITKKKVWEVSEFTANFAELVRQSMEYATTERIKISQELEFLKVYLDLESGRMNHDMKIRIDTTDYIETNKSSIMLPPLLIQPIVENAFKHAGFRTMQNAKLSISFKEYQNYIICVIEDNGLGYNKERKKPIKNKSHRSTGLNTVKERLRLNASLLGVSIDQDELFKIGNVEKNKGTKIELRIAYTS